MTENDQRLVAEAKKAQWWYEVPDEELADTLEAREILHQTSSALYHREEGEYI